MRSFPDPEALSHFKPKSPPSSHRHRRWLYAAAFLACASRAFATTTDNWTGGTDNWSLNTNWTTNSSTHLVPAAGNIVNITETDGVDRTITYDYTGAAINLGGLTIDLTNYSSAATTTLAMSAHSLSVHSAEYVGYSGTGTMNQSGGTNTVFIGNLYLGYNSGSNGTYGLSGTGALAVSGDEIVGNVGTGTFIQSGGTNTTSGNLYIANSLTQGTYTLSNGIATIGANAYVGVASNSLGNLTISGTGQMTVKGTLQVFAGQSVLNLQGGSLTVRGLSLGSPFTQFVWTGGTLDITGASGENLTIDSTSAANFGDSAGTASSFALGTNQTLIVKAVENVGYNGTGNFTQSGGTHTLNSGSALYLGYSSGSSGTYSLSDTGALSVKGSTEYVGYSGAGTFNQSGGNHTLDASSNLYVGCNTGSTGNYNLSGTGALSVAGAEFVGSSGTGNFNQTGGANIANNLVVGLFNTGTYSLSGTGTLSVTGTEKVGNLATGNFNQTAGIHTLNSGSTFIVGCGAGYSGTYNLSGTGVLSAIGSTEYIGYLGNGTFNQCSSIHTLDIGSELCLGYNSGSNGTYNLSGSGTLNTANDEHLGESGNGTFTQTGGNHSTSGFLYLGFNSGSNGNYTLSGNGSLSAPVEMIGHQGNGTFNQSGGFNLVSFQLYVGFGGIGNYNLSGNGSLNISNDGIESINGTFTQTGGNNSVSGFLVVGDFSTALYTLSGNGTLSAQFELLGEYGNGSFNQSGGNNSVSFLLNLGDKIGSTGNYTLSGNGTLSAVIETVGGDGNGTFNQCGGTNSASDALYLGSGGCGNYTLSGTGELITGSEVIGNSGNGTFTQSGGVNSVSFDLALGLYSGCTGNYLLSGNGTLTTVEDDIGCSGNGTFTQSGGNHSVSSTLFIGLESGSTGNYTMSNGTLSVNTIQINTGGNFNQTGGITIVSAGLTNFGNYTSSGSLQSSGDITNSGNFTQSGPQSWSNNTTFTNSGNATLLTNTGSALTAPLNILNTAGLLQLATPQNIKSLNITGGNVTLVPTANTRDDVGIVLKTSNLSIASTSILDISNHDMIIGNTTPATVFNEIANAFGFGPGGAEITSSSVVNNPLGNTFLAVLDANLLGGVGSTWDNVTITDPNSVIIKYTYFGDLNFDGIVDSGDYAVIDGNFGTGNSWITGDANLDGVVDAGDYAVIDGNFGAGTQFGTPLLNSPTPTPEPTSLLLLTLASAPLLLRRRKNITLTPSTSPPTSHTSPRTP